MYSANRNRQRQRLPTVLNIGLSRTPLKLALYLAALALSLLLGNHLWRGYQELVRGTEPAPDSRQAPLYGVNVSLERYPSQRRGRALDLAAAAGFGLVRQRFPWSEIEPRPGEHRWAPWDAIVEDVARSRLALLAVIDTSPAWARAEEDRDNAFAPPKDPAALAAFVGALVQRYGAGLDVLQVWDEPNIYPHWGERDADPEGYAALLGAAHDAAKLARPDLPLIAAGLAPTTEAGGRNLSDVVYLRRLYEAGLAEVSDGAAAKAYGFWSGPEDRRLHPRVLNFSRAVLLREEMVRAGDGQSGLWIVEMGWNAPPPGYDGPPPPWGADGELKQAGRLRAALERASAEWGWAASLTVEHLDPPVPADDPRRGFALLTPELEPRPAYEAVQLLNAPPASSTRPNLWPLRLAVLFVAGLGLVAAAGAGRQSARYPWSRWLRAAAAAISRRPEADVLLAGALLALVYHLAPWLLLAAAAFLGLVFLFYSRPALAVPLVVLAAPFYLHPRPLGRLELSLVEALMAAWALGWAARVLWPRPLAYLRDTVARWTGADWAALSLGAAALISLAGAEFLKVALRELRMVVLEPLLFYFLLRRLRLEPRRLLGVADVWLASGAMLAALGFYQLLAGEDLITAEGVYRIRAVFGSPNNLALYLGRMVPFLWLATVLGPAGWRRRLYAGLLVVIGLALALTFSRAALFLGLPLAVLGVSALAGRRVLLAAGALLLLVGLTALPFFGLERLAGLAETGQGTTLLRLKLWEASLDMLADHPLTGVGLDNFLYHYPDYIRPEAWREPDLSHPHNVVLDFWLRLGLPGVIVLAVLLWSFFPRAYRGWVVFGRSRPGVLSLGLLGGMLYVLAHGLVDASFFTVDLAYAFWLIYGLGVALGEAAQDVASGKVALGEAAQPPLQSAS